jgi:DNA invertase Pin-like site-specific DNA recombinase
MSRAGRYPNHSIRQTATAQDDPDDPMRTAIRQIQGVFVELDRKTVVKRLRDGRRAKAAEGKHAVGTYVYGYQGAGKGRQRDAGPPEDEQGRGAPDRPATPIGGVVSGHRSHVGR